MNSWSWWLFAGLLFVMALAVLDHIRTGLKADKSRPIGEKRRPQDTTHIEGPDWF